MDQNHNGTAMKPLTVNKNTYKILNSNKCNKVQHGSCWLPMLQPVKSTCGHIVDYTKTAAWAVWSSDLCLDKKLSILIHYDPFSVFWL